MKKVKLIYGKHKGIGRLFLISDRGVEEFEMWEGLTVDIEHAIEKALGVRTSDAGEE